MESIVWEDCRGKYKGNYQVDNLGNVRSLDRNVNTRGNGLRSAKGRIIKPFDNGNSYLSVHLSINGYSKPHRLNRLIYESFKGEIPDNYDVHHINGVRTDNRIENLELIEYRLHRSISQGNKTSKFIGISLDKRCNKWVSKIDINGKCLSLGRYENELEAAKSYQEALKLHHEGSTISQIKDANRRRRDAIKAQADLHKKITNRNQSIIDRRRAKRK